LKANNGRTTWIYPSAVVRRLDSGFLLPISGKVKGERAIMSSCCEEAACEVRRLESSARLCPECGRRGKSVARITLEHLLLEPVVREIGEASYFFCATPGCDTVYFSPSSGTTFRKRHLKVRIGIKETEEPIPVCYCFGHTRASVWAEIERAGASTVLDSIKRETQAGRCECEVKNPSGKCCLGEATLVVREGERLLLSSVAK
jgi:hypothetical protein